MDLFDLLFPKQCVGCNRVGKYFCGDCSKNILQSDLLCPYCQTPSLGGVTHPQCQTELGLDGVWSLAAYKGIIRTAVGKLKYRFISSIAQDFAEVVVEYWARHQPMFLEAVIKERGANWVVVPIPLYKNRENWRGFNQAAVVGKLIAQKTGLRYDPLLTRVQFVHTQVGLKAKQRQQNMQGVFKLSRSVAGNFPNILLIDDVWTTGSTMKEACTILKQTGAQKVWGVTIAR